MNRRSVLGASHVEVSATSYENNFFTLNVKKDDFNWSVKKRSSELIFFRNSILDVAARFNNSFPVLNEENKELLSELSDWLRECADVMNYSSAHSGIFYTFLKVNEYACRSDHDKEKLKNSDVDNINRRDPVKSALRCGYLSISFSSDHEHSGHHNHHHHHKHHDDEDISTNGMKKKYFTLCDHLNYYENEASYLARDEPEGVIKLDAYYITKLAGDDELENRNGNEFSLFSFSPYAIKCTLRASNSDEMEAWCATLSSFPSMI